MWSHLLSVALLSSTATSCLLPHEMHHVPGQSIFARQSQEDMDQYATKEYFDLIANNSIPVARNNTDRYRQGRDAPRGLGSSPGNTFYSYAMNVIEIESAVKALADEFGIEMFYAPEKTHDGATMFGAKVGGFNGTESKGCNDTYRVFLTAGIHARERGGPDNLIYFISDLLWAFRDGKGLTYNNQTYTYSQVEQVLSAGIIFMPLTNPDGVLFDQNTNLCWRKNRNPDGPVDLNRNFDFLWNFTEYFAPEVEPASTEPDAETFYGTGPFSEPETRNIKWVFDTHPKINWYMDIHSFSSAVLYPWGDDTNQDSDPAQNFTNSAYDGKRGVINDTAEYEYESYIARQDWTDVEDTAKRIARGMEAGNPSVSVQAVQGALFYPTSGSSSDYAYARGLANTSLTKIYGFGVEFGTANEAMGDVACPFYPSQTAFNQNVRSMGAGLMEFILAAREIGVGAAANCEASGKEPDNTQNSARRPGVVSSLVLGVVGLVVFWGVL